MATPGTNVVVREATNADLPQVWPLITESYLALAPYLPSPPSGPSPEQMMRAAADASIADELQDLSASFQRGPDDNFWVACSDDGTVVGCVALGRHSARTANLRCMAVSAKVRGAGIGKLLVAALIRYAQDHHYTKVKLVTANPRARDFYAKAAVGFLLYATSAGPVSAFFMVRYLGEQLRRRVVITGGTHGNERVGVALQRAWAEDAGEIKRDTFDTVVPVLANPHATALNRRYADRDLNRCMATEASDGPFQADGAAADAYETGRAAELMAEFGPKTADGLACKTDFWIDLHSTTSNTGLSLIVNGVHDSFGLRVAQHVQERFPAVRLMGMSESRAQEADVQSIATSGIGVEVGPIACGILQPGLLEATREIVICILDYLDAHNARLLAALPPGMSPLMAGNIQYVSARQGEAVAAAVIPSFPRPTVDVYDFASKVDFPRDAEGFLTHCFHPDFDGRCWDELTNDTVLFAPIRSGGAAIKFTRPEFEKPRFGTDPNTEPLHALFINEAA